MSEGAARRAFEKFVTCPLCEDADAMVAVFNPGPDHDDPVKLRAQCDSCGIKTEWVPL